MADASALTGYLLFCLGFPPFLSANKKGNGGIGIIKEATISTT